MKSLTKQKKISTTRKIYLFEKRKKRSMSEKQMTIKGTIVPLSFNASKCKVALRTYADGEEIEFPILSKGAGIDLIDMVSNFVSANCMMQPCEEEDCTKLHIRSYTILDELDENDLFISENK